MRSRLLTSLARQGDTVSRWGGEEFVVVLPETDLAGARRFAERLRRTIEAHSVGDMQTSASCGVATMLPEDSVEELLGAADQALYQAKSTGRNRTRAQSAARARQRPEPALSGTAASLSGAPRSVGCCSCRRARMTGEDVTARLIQ